ncbi:MAG TPA: hypothetical protein PKY70_16675, partial [Nakamurella multipartita]|nr:hypothetical protein [Nakamurella multipartita]
FTTIRWVDVTMVFQPAPGDPVRIRRSDGKLFVLSGVGLDRLPGILALAPSDPMATQPRRSCGSVSPSCWSRSWLR